MQYEPKMKSTKKINFLKYSINFFNLLWIINLPLIVVILNQDKEHKMILTFYHVCFISMSSFLHFISYLFFKKIDNTSTNLEEMNVFLSLLNCVHLLLLLYFLVLVKVYSVLDYMTTVYIILPIVVNFLEILKNRQIKS